MKYKIELIKNYLALILTIIIIVLLLHKSCNNPLPNLDVQPTTIYKSDTIFNIDTLVELKTIYKPKHDTIYKTDSVFNLDTLVYVREYNDSLTDTNLTLYSKAKVIGILDELELSYKMKSKPILITNNITKIETVYKPSKLSIYTGVEVGGNTASFNLSPFVNLNVNKTSIEYRYGILDETHNISVGYKIFNSKK